MRKVMDHTAVSAIQASSVTLKIWQHGAKENYCSLTTFNRPVLQGHNLTPIFCNGSQHLVSCSVLMVNLTSQ